MISDAVLPTKSQLIKILKEHLHVDYRLFKLEGLKNIKERIIIMIFIYHKVLREDSQSNDEIESREEVEKEIRL